ncbi:MAG TPA: hypothetical protein VGF24_37425 [Vicinamibacterales bacterium]|jgi:hypothetical protein
MDADDVTAVIVTRGDCDIEPILASLIFDKVCIWDNKVAKDLGAYGRYEAIAHFVHTNVVYAQDDDCVVAPEDQYRLIDAYEPGTLTALMPAERTDYHDTVLIGWGSIFDRAMPALAFQKWIEAGHEIESREFRVVGADFVFPILSKWKRLDAEHVDLPQASADNRTWASFLNYGQIKQAFLREGRRIRDGD